MDKVLTCSLMAALALLCVACQDKRSDLEKTLYPNGTPPGVTFEAAGDDAADDNPPNDHGKPFLQDLIRTTQLADQVVVIEHSYIYDDAEADINSKFLPERIYKQVALGDAERDHFISSLRAIDPYVSMYAAACVYEPHHRFEFYNSSKRIGTLEVCFQCAQLKWDGAQKGEPQAFYSGMEIFVKSIGLQPDRDWHALAKQASRP